MRFISNIRYSEIISAEFVHFLPLLIDNAMIVRHLRLYRGKVVHQLGRRVRSHDDPPHTLLKRRRDTSHTLLYVCLVPFHFLYLHCKCVKDFSR